jgi:pyroglutamyl-peptidase
MASLSADPRLLLCGFGAFPDVPANPSALVVERLRARGWAPPDAAVDYAVLPTAWDEAADALRAAQRDSGARGVLLTGVAASAAAFRMEMRARNRASTTALDAAGRRHGAARISPAGPAVLRATAPVQAVVEAIRAEGLPAAASSDCGDYLCNHTLYRLLEDQADERGLRPVGFLHLPPEGVAFSLDDLERGVKAAATVMARALAFAAPEPLDA